MPNNFWTISNKIPTVCTPMHIRMIEQPLKLAHRQDFWNNIQMPWNYHFSILIPELIEIFCMEIHFLKRWWISSKMSHNFRTIFWRAGNSDKWTFTQEMLSRLESFYTSSNLTEFTSERVANIVEFQDKQSFPTTEGTKLERFLPKNQLT